MAEQSGAALGASLYKLVEAAGHADDMAEAFLEANGEISGTGDGTDGSFRSRETRTGSASPVEAWWMMLRDQLQGILGENYTNLSETAVALRKTAAAYAAADGAAAEKLRTSIAEYNTSPDDDLGKIEYPSTDEPDPEDKPDMPDGYTAPEPE